MIGIYAYSSFHEVDGGGPQGLMCKKMMKKRSFVYFFTNTSLYFAYLKIALLSFEIRAKS
jgi:hypothetical protein